MLERPQRHRGFADPPEHLGFSADVSVSSSTDAAIPTSSSAGNAPANAGNVDRVLFKNLVEIVPLVESLMDRRANSSFTRRASMIYTPMPSNMQKVIDSKGRKPSQTVSARKRRDLGEGKQLETRDNGVEEFSIFTSNPLAVEAIQKERDELTVLQEQIDDLTKRLKEKDEALKCAQDAVKQLEAVHTTLDKYKSQVVEKDSLIKSINSQLSNAKINLADKQALLEKLEWQAKTLNKKLEELQGDMESKDFEVNALMRIFEELSKSDAAKPSDEDITYCDPLIYPLAIDSTDESEMERMEEARLAYMAAVTALKENPNDELIVAAAEARKRLQSFLL